MRKRIDFILVDWVGGAVSRRSSAFWPAFRSRTAKLGYDSADEADRRRRRVLEICVEKKIDPPDLRVMMRTTETRRSTAYRQRFETTVKIEPVLGIGEVA